MVVPEDLVAEGVVASSTPLAMEESAVAMEESAVEGVAGRIRW
jgi:hypothetical protein